MSNSELPITPIEQYQLDVKTQNFTPDSAQLAAVEKLNELYLALIEQAEGQSLLSKLKAMLKGNAHEVKGLYMHGGVGRGKTYIMDLFYETLPLHTKKRMHFHRFMYWVHAELKQYAGEQDPILKIAKAFAEQHKVICFDEFFVSDIGDAMILGTLMEALFEQGVTLVATSNIEPERLYHNGLQRSRFEPAIAAIIEHCDVLNVDGGIDYRLRTLEQAEIYHSPLDEQATTNLHYYFSQLAVDEIKRQQLLVINDREIDTIAFADGIIWTSFAALCATERSSADYIELSRLYHSVLISDIPQLEDAHNDQARRFISLVDEFYERNVKLIVSAAVPLDSLYIGKGLDFEFKRTLSRLQEMQSHEYLARPHLP